MSTSSLPDGTQDVDDKNINARPVYHSAVMLVPAHVVGVPSGGNKGQRQ
jgi:hypothetical protein